MKRIDRPQPPLPPHEAALLALLRRGLFGLVDDSAFAAPLDWQAVFAEARIHAVASLALEAALALPKELQPPENILEPWRGLSLFLVARNERLMAEQSRIIDALVRAGIPVAVLKGSSAAAAYPKPELRALGDIDLLIDTTDLDRASECLAALGMEKVWCAEDFHLAFHNDHCHLELHWEATWYPDTPVGETLRALMRSAAADTAQMRYHEHIFPALTPERQLASLLLHMQRHMKSTGIGLRHLCDIAAYFTRVNPNDWESSVAPALKAGGLYRFARALCKTCVLYLGLPASRVPWCEPVDSATCDSLIREFLACGNFGRKDAAHRAGSVLSADKAGQGATRFLPLTLIRNVNLYARNTYKIARKAPVTLPFFWAYVPAKYLLGRKRQGAKADVPGTLQAARARRALYARLGIFEVEK